MPYAVITIDKIDKNDGNYMHFKDKSQKAWNCNKPELIASMVEGERYKIDYNETEPKAGRKYGSKYINRARFWQEDDGPNTWPDKEPYSGGGGGQSYSGNKGGSMKKDYDPEVSKRQTAANCAMSYLANAGVTVAELESNFTTVADIVMKYLNGGATKSDAGVSNSGSDEGTASVPDEDFGF